MAGSGARSKLRRLNYAKYGYIFILPFFLIYCIFSLYPLLYTFYLSTTRDVSSGASKSSTQVLSVGLDNFKSIITVSEPYTTLRSEVVSAFANTFQIWTMNFVPQVALSLLLAIWFTDSRLKIRGKGFFKTMIYMPNIITAASIASLFLTLLGETTLSPVNGFLYDVGIITDTSDTIKFLTNVSVRKVVIAFIQCWMWYGNTMIIFIATINGINPSLFEAAQIDGASSRQQFFKVTLPLIKPMMLYTFITSMIGGLQMYDIPYLFQLTRGTLPAREQTIVVMIFDLFNSRSGRPQYGLAATISVFLFVVTAILSCIVFYLMRDKDAIAQKKHMKKIRKQQIAKVKGKAGGLGI